MGTKGNGKLCDNEVSLICKADKSLSPMSGHAVDESRGGGADV